MGKKKRGFQWVREDQEGVAIERAIRRDKTGMRDESRALSELGTAIAAMPKAQRMQLPLHADLQTALDVLERQGPKPGRRRALLRVQKLLRGQDIPRIEAAMKGDTEAAARARSLERHRSRILELGDPAIQDFIDAHTDADRPRIRTLARQAKGDSPAAIRAHKQLFQVLKGATPRPEGEE